MKTLISALLHRYDQLLTRHPLHCNYHKETALVNNIMEKEYFRQNSNVTLFSDFDMSTSYLKQTLYKYSITQLVYEQRQ